WLILLHSHRIRFDESVNALQHERRLVQRLHLHDPCAVEPWTCGHYFTLSSLGFSRSVRPTFASGLPFNSTTSAVKSNRPSNRAAPTPYASTGTCTSSNAAMRATSNPPETTIFTSPNPSASSALRTFHTRLAFTPVG